MRSYLVILGLLLLAGIGVPIPEEITLLAAGYEVNQGSILVIMYIVAVAGIVCGDLTIYMAGRYFGEGITNSRLFRRIANEEKLQHWERLVEAKGWRVVVVARFTPAVRAVAFLAMGVLRYNWRAYLITDLLAALPFCAILMTFGYYFGEYKDRFKTILHRIDMLIILVVIGVAGYLVYYHLTSHPKLEDADPESKPRRASQAEAAAAPPEEPV